jgi:spore coat protein U-like protein
VGIFQETSSAAMIGAVLLGAPFSAEAATRSGTASAVTLRPLSLVKTEDLDFGTVISGPATGTVSINANTGARTTTGGAVASGGTPRRAEFVGVGRLGILSIVSISPPPTLTNGSGGSMTSALAVQGGTGIRLFTGTGVQTFRVGGTINVGANQAAGDYAGTFTLTVNYL